MTWVFVGIHFFCMALLMHLYLQSCWARNDAMREAVRWHENYERLLREKQRVELN